MVFPFWENPENRSKEWVKMEPLPARESIIAERLARAGAWKKALIIICYFSIGSYALLGFVALNFKNSITEFIGAVSSGNDLIALFVNSLETNENIYTASGILDLLVGLFALISLVGWTHANAKLANQIDFTSLSFSPGWAIGAWFVPFLNFVRPREIIEESQTTVSSKLSKGLLNTWWGFFVASWIINVALGRIELQTASRLDSLSDSASWSSIESAFYDYSAVLSLNVINYWFFSIVPMVLLLIFIRKTPAAVDLEKDSAEPLPLDY